MTPSPGLATCGVLTDGPLAGLYTVEPAGLSTYCLPSLSSRLHLSWVTELVQQPEAILLVEIHLKLCLSRLAMEGFHL